MPAAILDLKDKEKGWDLGQFPVNLSVVVNACLKSVDHRSTSAFSGTEKTKKQKKKQKKTNPWKYKHKIKQVVRSV